MQHRVAHCSAVRLVSTATDVQTCSVRAPCSEPERASADALGVSRPDIRCDLTNAITSLWVCSRVLETSIRPQQGPFRYSTLVALHPAAIDHTVRPLAVQRLRFTANSSSCSSGPHRSARSGCSARSDHRRRTTASRRRWKIGGERQAKRSCPGGTAVGARALACPGVAAQDPKVSACVCARVCVCACACVCMHVRALPRSLLYTLSLLVFFPPPLPRFLPPAPAFHPQLRAHAAERARVVVRSGRLARHCRIQGAHSTHSHPCGAAPILMPQCLLPARDPAGACGAAAGAAGPTVGCCWDTSAVGRASDGAMRLRPSRAEPIETLQRRDDLRAADIRRPPGKKARAAHARHTRGTRAAHARRARACRWCVLRARARLAHAQPLARSGLHLRSSH